MLLTWWGYSSSAGWDAGLGREVHLPGMRDTARWVLNVHGILHEAVHDAQYFGCLQRVPTTGGW